MHDGNPLALLDDVRKDAQRGRDARVVLAEYTSLGVGIDSVVAGLPVHLRSVDRCLHLVKWQWRLALSERQVVM